MPAPRNSVPMPGLAARRRALGLTQARLARLAQVSRNRVTLIEGGEPASRSTAALIEQALRVASANHARATAARSRVVILDAVIGLDAETAAGLLRGLADEIASEPVLAGAAR
ncbi:helix-turn-helix domain-containing protein [Catenuloplanes sp. NPDC051500]|uniref:helix-turn-helix domain-containing protein n=1 Tax=Catenuloplanes sp. NPDC051500 TaxID=3363959 RepID=UPI0037898011